MGKQILKIDLSVLQEFLKTCSNLPQDAKFLAASTPLDEDCILIKVESERFYSTPPGHQIPRFSVEVGGVDSAGNPY